MPEKMIAQNEAGRNTRALIITLLMTICIAWLYRQQIQNGFTILAGDPYDGVISTTILEHWYNVFRGEASWLEVGYFYPHVRTLANTDGYFIVGLIYTPFRMLGIDSFTSAELANIVIKMVGYLGMYWMCRRVFSLPFHWSVLAAILFTLSNGMTTHSSRSQLATIAFAPIMATLLYNAAIGVKTNDFGKVRIYGILSSILFGAWCLTGFYAAWFFVYFFTVFCVIALFAYGKPGLVLIKQQISKHGFSYLLIFACSALSIAPFVYAFLPKSQETGVRNYAEALAFTVPPENILQLGKENLFVGKIYNQILLTLEPGYLPANDYYNTGFGILLFFIFIVAAIRSIRTVRTGGDKFVFSLIVATLITWLTTLNFGGISLWYGVFHFMPGAKALRVVSTCTIFLALPLTIIVVRHLSLSRLAPTLTVIISALLIVEELNTPTETLNLVRKTEMARVALPAMPPVTCKSFYTSGWRDQSAWAPPAEMYAHNVTAMLIAQKVNIPTVNGFASFMAPDWDFGYPNKPDYEARVLSYASKNELKGLCRLDLDSKKWTVVEPSAIRTFALDVAFFEKSDWDGAVSGFSGLSAQEPWGRWSDAKTIKLDFTKPLPRHFELHLDGKAFAKNVGKPFEATLMALTNGELVPSGGTQTFTLTEENSERTIRFDNPLGLHRISITVPHPVSPHDLGGGAQDDRTLGLGLQKIRIVPR